MQIQVNLVPGTGKKSKGRASSAAPSFDIGAALAQLKARVTDPLLLGAVVAVVAGGAAIAWMNLSQAQAESTLTEQVEKEVRDSTRFASVLKARAGAQAVRDTVLRQ